MTFSAKRDASSGGVAITIHDGPVEVTIVESASGANALHADLTRVLAAIQREYEMGGTDG